jgi:hypothetical protein
LGLSEHSTVVYDAGENTIKPIFESSCMLFSLIKERDRARLEVAVQVYCWSIPLFCIQCLVKSPSTLYYHRRSNVVLELPT